MREYLKFYIDGKWVDPVEPKTLDVDNPATEQVSGKIALGSAADVDKAVKAARKAFATWSQTSREERLDVLQRILAEYQKRVGDLAAAVTEEMGAPASLRQGSQVGLGIGHLSTAIEVLKNFKFEEQRGATLIVKEPIGVCGLITPWNWPMNQIAVQGFPGARDRLHDGAEAVGGGAVLGADLRRDHACRRRSGRRVQPRPGRRARRGRRRCPAIPRST